MRPGPVTLPCGHNGCSECLATVQAQAQGTALCPLCRAPFDAAVPLQLNHELQQLLLESAEHPSAPPLPAGEGASVLMPSRLVYGGIGVLELEPPVWVPDSAAPRCMAAVCGRPFSLAFPRHHCRLCGQVFCCADSQGATNESVRPAFLFDELQQPWKLCRMHHRDQHAAVYSKLQTV